MAPGSNSGGEVYERELLHHMAELGDEFRVILARGKQHVPHRNISITRPWLHRGLRWPVMPFVMPQTIRQCWPFDVLRAHSLRYIGPSALWARRRYRLDVPVVAHHHHLDTQRWIERKVVLACDKTVVGSQYSKRQLCNELDIPPEKVAVVPYGVDTDKFVPVDRRGPDSVVVLTVGVKARKRVTDMLHKWREVVAAAARPCHLIIIGSSPDLESLKAYAVKANVPSVYFTGRVSEKTLIGYYQAADVYWSTSAREGFGFSVAEAMAAGLPCVVPAGSSLEELVVDGQGGVVSRDGDAYGVVALINHPDARREMGEYNRRRVLSEYQWSTCAKRTHDVYEEVLKTWNR